MSVILHFTKEEKKCPKIFKKPQMMARKLLCDYCAKLIDFIKNIIHSDSFVEQHKQKPTDFTRNRKLSFQGLIAFFLNLISGSYQKELDNFYQKINGFDIPKRIVTKAALTKARMKLKYEAFIELNRQLIHFFHENCKNFKTWHGFNLLAVDTTLIRLPRIQKIAEHFGAWHPINSDEECPMARASQMFDPLNRVTVDAIINTKDDGDRELAARHFLKLMPSDLVLLDRGYPAYWLFCLILMLKANFCARISDKKWIIVRKFRNSGKREKIISLTPSSKASIDACKEMGLEMKPLKLRLIRIDLPSGQTEILITSLLDTDLYPIDIFFDLYHQRWFVEEDFKKIKCWIEVENFTGKSVLSVYQDFHANVFSKNLTQMFALSAQPLIQEMDKDREYPHQVNFAQALSVVKNTIILLFNRPMEAVYKILTDLIEFLSITTEPIRPNRKYPRKPKRRRNYYINYKPIG